MHKKPESSRPNSLISNDEIEKNIEKISDTTKVKFTNSRLGITS
jgi:hypothetical protein